MREREGERARMDLKTRYIHKYVLHVFTKKWSAKDHWMECGILFWKAMYIPVLWGQNSPPPTGSKADPCDIKQEFWSCSFSWITNQIHRFCNFWSHSDIGHNHLWWGRNGVDINCICINYTYILYVYIYIHRSTYTYIYIMSKYSEIALTKLNMEPKNAHIEISVQTHVLLFFGFHVDFRGVSTLQPTQPSHACRNTAHHPQRSRFQIAHGLTMVGFGARMFADLKHV